MSSPPADSAIREIFAALPGYYLILSADLRIVTATEATLQATGTSLAKIMGKTLQEAFPGNPATTPGALAEFEATCRQLLATREPCHLPVTRYDLPDPVRPGKFTETYWGTTFTPALAADGEVRYIIREAVNVTGSVVAERQLREYQRREQKAAIAEAQHRLEGVLKQLPAGICIFGAGMRYEFFNKAYQGFFPGRELEGKTLLEVAPELRDQEIVRVIEEVYRTGEPYEGKEMRVPLAPAPGEPLADRYFNVIFQPRKDASGSVDGIVNFSYDVTELVQARQKIEADAAQVQLYGKSL